MFTFRNLDGNTVAEMLNPSFRPVRFKGDSAMAAVTTRTRQAWLLPPPPLAPGKDTYGQSDIGTLLVGIQHLSDDEVAAMSTEDRNPDTPFRRDAVYGMWNHVFWDVMKFLPEVGSGIGHFHPPKCEVFPLEFEKKDDGEGGKGVSKKWDTHVLLIYAYLGAGVSVEMREVKGGGGQKLGVYGAAGEEETKYEVWWLRKGTEVSFHVDGAGEEGSEGLAAVLAVGVLCDEDHGGEEVEEVED